MTFPYNMPGIYVVSDFGARGDGKTDDTRDVQAALDAAGRAGGGVVCLPPGRYVLAGNLRVPPHVTLSGIWQAPSSHPGLRDKNRPKPEYGTVLLVLTEAGSEGGEPLVSLVDNSGLQGVAVYYPEQKSDREPVPYPWTIQMRGNNCFVQNVELLNPYQGIDARYNQRHLIRNVHGQPLRRGIWIDEIYDIGRVENVHFNPWWSMQPGLFNWQMAHGEAFIIGRSDWQYVLNTFCFGYRVGYRFTTNKRCACNGNFLGIGADDCWVACLIEDCAPFGLLITNGEFVSFHGPDPTMIEVAESHRGSVRFVNCAFWGPTNQIARIRGEGTVGFSDCTFMQWDRNQEGRAAIQAESGTVLVRGCEFRADAPQVYLGALVKRAVIAENAFAGSERIVNKSRGNVQVGLNSSG